jgi:tetratricopeptide (TPR) repeat protein
MPPRVEVHGHSQFGRFISLAAFTALLLHAGPPSLDDALALQRQGKLKEARDLLRAEAVDFRAAADPKSQAKALSMASQISLSLGDYRSAISEAESGAQVRRSLDDKVGLAEDFNTLGLANLYLGNYSTALSNYQQALKLDLDRGSAEGEIARQNNIGNVYYFQGHYSEALRAYQVAMDKVNATTSQKWNARRRQLTIANLATLYQRLGKEQTALELYQQLDASPQAMPVSEHAQLLLNKGVLFRRLGDPIKALELYHEAQTLFAKEHHRDGEIGAYRNIGTARALDLNDLPGAQKAFTTALQLAQESSNARGIAQAELYRGEVLRRLHRLDEAEKDARDALAIAQAAGLVEEQWMAEFALGNVAEETQRSELAYSSYQAAIKTIESVRSGLGLPMRREFLADKRDVYDAIVALRLKDRNTSLPEIFSWIERSRARTLVERVQSASVREAKLSEIQSRLPPDTVLLDFWVGPDTSAAIWMTTSSSGLIRHSGGFNDAVSRLLAALQESGDAWKDLSRSLGAELLAGLPSSAHLLVVPDGPLGAVPFEALIEPGSGRLLIEQRGVGYLPSAQFLSRAQEATAKWSPPWHRQLLAIGDPPVSEADTFASAERWQPLPGAAEEVAGIAHLLPGRSEIYLGAEARKRQVLDGKTAGVSMLHFSTHAVVDDENPDRSRILLAPDGGAAPFDYLFQSEAYNLNLDGVDLATISACDTARGTLIRGEGIEAFSNAFLAAGSAATITSLWRVPDRPTADFMKQLYYYLAQGKSKSEALRLAKLQFLRSNTMLANPRYWAAFVLNGDGWNPTRRFVPWGVLAGAAAILLAMVGWMLTTVRRRRARRIATVETVQA